MPGALPARGVRWILFAPLMPARTLAGARLLRQVRGYEQFIRRVECDRCRRQFRRGIGRRQRGGF